MEFDPEGSAEFEEAVERGVGLPGLDVAEARPADPGHFGEPLLGKTLFEPGGDQCFANVLNGFPLGVRFHP